MVTREFWCRHQIHGSDRGTSPGNVAAWAEPGGRSRRSDADPNSQIEEREVVLAAIHEAGHAVAMIEHWLFDRSAVLTETGLVR